MGNRDIIVIGGSSGATAPMKTILRALPEDLPAAFEARYVWTEEVNASGDKRKVPDKRLPEANVMDAAQYVILSRVRGDGTTVITHGLPRGPADPGAAVAPGGLSTAWDALNPYGGRS